MAFTTDAALLGAAGAGGGGGPYSGDLAVTLSASPYIKVYAWTPSGFGAAYSNPASLTSRAAGRVDWSPDNTVIVCGGAAYAWSSSGFGSKYTDTTVTFNAGVEFNPSGLSLVTCGNSINIAATAWSNSTGFGTRYTLPSAFGNNINDGCFNSAGTVAAYTAFDGAGLKLFRWNNPGFGSQFSNPAGTDYCTAVTFNSSDSVLFIGRNAGSRILAFSWSNSTGFGSQYSNPSVLPSSGLQSGTITASPNGDAVCFGTSGSPYFHGYPWSDSTGFGTKYSNPTGITSAPLGAAFSPDGAFVAVVGSATNFIKVYPFDPVTGFGTPVSDPASLPGTGCNDCTFRRVPV